MFFIVRDLNDVRYYASTDIDWKPFSETAIWFPDGDECWEFKQEHIWEKDAMIIWHTN